MKPEIVLKAVFDTNIFISAFLFPDSAPAQIYVLAIRKAFKLGTSAAIMAETAEKLRSKFQTDEDDVVDLLKQIARISEIVKPTSRVTVVADNPDNRVLECALSVGADLIVSGDKHLLKLKSFEGIRVVRVADFLRLFP